MSILLRTAKDANKSRPSPAKKSVFLTLTYLFLAQITQLSSGAPALAHYPTASNTHPAPKQSIHKRPRTPSTRSTNTDIRPLIANLVKDKDIWKVLNDQRFIRAVDKLAGDDAEDFWSCIQCTQPLTSKCNYLFTTGSVVGLYDDRTSFVCIETMTGKIVLGYLIDKVEHVYGVPNLKALPAPAADYIKLLDSSFDVVYERRKHHVLARTAAKQNPRPPINLDSLTGTYERPTSRFTSGSLKIQALPDNKIQFAVEALSGGHSGGAAGTIAIADKKAVYKGSEIFANDKGYLNFSFNRGAIDIDGTELPFCGAGVTLNGTYTKVDDKKPIFDNP